MLAGNRPARRTAGVGIDIEQLTVLDRFDGLAIARATARWLSPAERAWCTNQSSAARALLIVVCCREAVFKATRGARPAHELALRLDGDLAGGRGGWYDGRRLGVEVEWWAVEGRLLALAMAASQQAHGGPCRRSS